MSCKRHRPPGCRCHVKRPLTPGLWGKMGSCKPGGHTSRPQVQAPSSLSTWAASPQPFFFKKTSFFLATLPQTALPSSLAGKEPGVTCSRQDHRLRAGPPALPLSPAPSHRALRGFRCTLSFSEWKQRNEKYCDQLLVLDHIYGRVEVITVIYFVETFILHLYISLQSENRRGKNKHK